MGHSSGSRSRHLNLEFELKCVIGLPGYFAGTFSGYYIYLDPPLFVDSSFVCSFLTLLYILASASAEKPTLIFECAIHILDFAPDVRGPAELLTNHPNHHTLNVASLRNGGTDYRAGVHGY